MVRQGRRHGPSIMHKITPCWVNLHQPARRAAVLGRASSLRSSLSRTTRFQSVTFLDLLILLRASTSLTDSTVQGDGMGLLESWRGLPGGTSVIMVGCIIYFTLHLQLDTRSPQLSSPCHAGQYGIGTGSPFSQLPSRYKWQPPPPSPLSSSWAGRKAVRASPLAFELLLPLHILKGASGQIIMDWKVSSILVTKSAGSHRRVLKLTIHFLWTYEVFISCTSKTFNNIWTLRRF